jgi:lipopolysaccharide/colanic/teichoic acid biosynthesis glycosyltransferase
MKTVLLKERIRCDRHAQNFGLIVTQLFCKSADYKKRLKQFSEVLHERLRIIDERGMLDGGHVAILLPMTDYAGTRHVLASITNLAAERGIFFRAKIVQYPIAPLPQSTNDLGCNDQDNDPQSPNGNYVTLLDDAIAGQTNLGFANIPVSCQSVSVGNAFDYVTKKYPIWKRAFDVTAASAGIMATVPVIAIAAIAIRLTSEGPVFFKQARTGQYGKKFYILKLRTMVKNAEELKPSLRERNERDGPAFKIKADPRVTRVGSLLRRTGIDELPQLFNVLKGEMAIVGPRPLPCAEDADCELWQRRRLDTKPGLTCYWQISKSRNIRFADWMRMDLRYSDRRSFTGDVMLVFKTCVSVFLGRVGH